MSCVDDDCRRRRSSAHAACGALEIDGYTIVIVTHDMQQAARVSDSTAAMYQGKLLEVDPMSDVFTNPRLQQTQDYITGRFGEARSRAWTRRAHAPR